MHKACHVLSASQLGEELTVLLCKVALDGIKVKSEVLCLNLCGFVGIFVDKGNRFFERLAYSLKKLLVFAQ